MGNDWCTEAVTGAAHPAQAFDICSSLHKSAFTSLFLQTIVQSLQVPFVMAHSGRTVAAQSLMHL